MTTISIKTRDGLVERALLNGGFDRNAFLMAATLVKARHQASRPKHEARHGTTSNGQSPAQGR